MSPINNKNNNTSIHQTSACASVCTRTRERPGDGLRYCGISDDEDLACWNCRFFLPIESDPDRDHPCPDDCLAGECRAKPPHLGDPLQPGESMRWGLYPIVMAGDWCGQFYPRVADVATCGDSDASAD